MKRDDERSEIYCEDTKENIEKEKKSLKRLKKIKTDSSALSENKSSYEQAKVKLKRNLFWIIK